MWGQEMARLNLKDIITRYKWLILLLVFPVVVYGAKHFQEVVAAKLDVDNIRLDGNTISSTDTDGNIVLNPNGSGNVNLPDLTVDTVPVVDSSGDLISTSVSQTELELLNGVTSFITESSTSTFTNKSIDSDNNTITNIVNADIKAAAAIAVNKLAALTASRAVETDGSGFASASSVTSTELVLLSGITTIGT